MERGDAYAAEKRDEFAVIEYASAVQIDPTFGDARLKLAETYERLNNLAAALPEYVRAADALPENRAVQLKAAEALLLAGAFEDARGRADALIGKNPKDVDALLLRANAMAGLRDLPGAIRQIEEALKTNPGDSRALLSLGAAHMEGGGTRQAEAAFREAMSSDPSSIPARLAFANFLSTEGRAQEAEAALKEVLAREPRHLLGNRMLGVLYLATQRVEEAEQPLKLVAEVAGAPEAGLQLADYYTSVGRAGDATRVLAALSADRRTHADAEWRLGAIEYAQNQRAEAHERIDAVLAQTPTHVPSLLRKAEWLAGENQLDQALARANEAVAADSQSSNAFYVLGTVHERRGDTVEAIRAYTESTRLNPRADRAFTALSRVNLPRNRAAAVQQAEQANRTAPLNGDARVALIRGLLASNNLARAEAEITELLKLAPDAGGVYSLQGTLFAARGQAAAARAAYERALQLSPGYFEALAGLTFLDLQAKTPAQAIPRIEARLAQEPANPRLLALAGQAYAAAGDLSKAEASLRRSVSVDPTFTPGYEQLAGLYVRQRQLDKARVELEGVARRDPSAVGARTMVGMLFEAEGKRDEARTWYEAMVKDPSTAPVAANNLAFIYAEQGTNLDMALQLAAAAKAKLPQDPNVDDTIGWVYYKKDLASLAVAPLEESLRKRPDTAEVLAHLGLTYAKLGNKDKARQALGRALKLDPAAGGGEARRVLTSLSQ